MKKILILNTLEQIKAISHPYRMDILKSFSRDIKQPCSVKMIADEMGESPSKLHYHIKELEKNGLLEVVDTREINGIIEKFYLPTAERITIEKDLVSAEEWMAETQQMICDMLDDAKDKIINNSFETHSKAGIHNEIVYLEPDKMEEFSERYNALVTEYSDPNRPGVKAYDSLLVYYPHVKKK